MKKRICRSLALLLAVLTVCGPLGAMAAQTAQQDGTWYIEDYTDDFGDPTGDHFMSCELKGTYSTPTAINREFTVNTAFGLNAQHFVFTLYKCSNNQYQAVNDYFSFEDITIRFEIDNEIYEYPILNRGVDKQNIYLNNDYERQAAEDRGMPVRQSGECGYDKLYEQLLRGSDVQTVLLIGSTKYSFVIPAGNFEMTAAEAFESERGRAI